MTLRKKKLHQWLKKQNQLLSKLRKKQLQFYNKQKNLQLVPMIKLPKNYNKWLMKIQIVRQLNWHNLQKKKLKTFMKKVKTTRRKLLKLLPMKPSKRLNSLKNKLMN